MGSTAASMAFTPNTVNLGSMGQWVDVKLGVPAGYDPNQFLAQTAFVTVDGVTRVGPPEWSQILGPDPYGVYTIHMKFNRSAVEAILTVGPAVTVWCYGEINCTTYLAGSATIKVIRPKLNTPNGGATYTRGYPTVNNLFVAWEKPMRVQPDGAIQYFEVDSYAVYFSADGGESWQLVAENITNQSVIVEVPNVDTDSGLYMVCAVDDGEIVGYDMSDETFTVCASSAGVKQDFIPTVFALKQNWPNPFSASTTVLFDLPQQVDVKLSVFDVRGRLVKSLVDQVLPAGRYYAGWDGRDANGADVASGVYFCKINAGSFNETKRMVVVK